MAKRFYSDYEVEKSREDKAASMMPSGAGSFANMPQETVMREFPKVHEYLPEVINDGLGGIDAQISGDHSKMKSGMKPRK